MAPLVAAHLFFAVAFAASNINSTNIYYASARVESCSGCRLSRLPDVKQFIFEDLPNYNNVEFKHIPGAVPELLLFNDNEEEIERLPLSSLTREECNNLLISKGFTKKASKDEI
ncbi:selenoprotein M-like [Bombus vancouverensis nearcticus]|uniref:Selenoprotein M n=1 Tax=Bombus bifarius TaxID=103933 RepID=A0A6P8LSD2_9HYME|nr:selenoprotein M-like [Bombus vancouverensis nearcticus]XP_033301174.1 selenoprotein M-like [Bombus bifarius]